MGEFSLLLSASIGIDSAGCDKNQHCIDHLFDIGFLSVRIWDLLDIIIVAFLIYRVYRLLKGGLAFYIFLGITLMLILWWIVTALKMELLTLIMGQFVSVGVIALVIIFQPEIRKFLIMLGNNIVSGKVPFLKSKLFRMMASEESETPVVAQIHSAILRLSRDRTGALIVLAQDLNFPGLEDSGILLNADISKQMIISIFVKESPLHDGAMVIYNDKIYKASCILPVSDNINLPASAGLRHRAALGLTEISDATVFVVSEETGKVSYAFRGVLHTELDEQAVLNALRKVMSPDYTG